jgi:hypothetical protein
MKHGTNTMEGNTDSGASSLAEFRAACAQQTLNISPGDIRSDGVLENGLQCPTMSGSHGKSLIAYMPRPYDLPCVQIRK